MQPTYIPAAHDQYIYIANMSSIPADIPAAHDQYREHIYVYVRYIPAAHDQYRSIPIHRIWLLYI